jgi:hypothetical protein
VLFPIHHSFNKTHFMGFFCNLFIQQKTIAPLSKIGHTSLENILARLSQQWATPMHPKFQIIALYCRKFWSDSAHLLLWQYLYSPEFFIPAKKFSDKKLNSPIQNFHSLSVKVNCFGYKRSTEYFPAMPHIRHSRRHHSLLLDKIWR